MNTLVDDIATHDRLGTSIRRRLRVEGPRLMHTAMKHTSLRELARRTDLSPTYLSFVLNRHCVISAKGYLKLRHAAREAEEE